MQSAPKEKMASLSVSKIMHASFVTSSNLSTRPSQTSTLAGATRKVPSTEIEPMVSAPVTRTAVVTASRSHERLTTVVMFL